MPCRSSRASIPFRPRDNCERSRRPIGASGGAAGAWGFGAAIFLADANGGGEPVDFAAAVSDAMREGMVTTNDLHLQGKSSVGGSFRAVAAPDSQSSPDGNAVVVEEQMMKVSETQMAYAEASGLYKKMFAMWRTALGSHG